MNASNEFKLLKTKYTENFALFTSLNLKFISKNFFKLIEANKKFDYFFK